MNKDQTDHAAHVGSHTNLLTDLSEVVGSAKSGTVDAIVVPTIAPQRVGSAIALAEALKCTIVLLCSTSSQVRDIGKSYDLPSNALCLEAPPGYGHPLLDFEQRAMEKHTDIAMKRNIGLLLARLCGWRTILFLDDDIRGMKPSLILRAAALTEQYRVVGFQIPDFPDNSVVCHANRVSGGAQSTFVGGNAILVDTSRADTYFPAIYNEDWLFLYDAVADRSVGVAGRLRQLAYDPFARNAAPEEFGELVAEGLVRALHFGSDVSTLSFWADAIKKRSRFIDEVADRLHGSARAKDERIPDRDRILLRLDEAKKRLLEISPVTCLSFYRTWRKNVDIWQRQLLDLPTSLTPQQAVRYLRLSSE
ncbi:hypothetical protein BKA00_002394 [Actinomadura coerulea]|uniref:Glycosyltransferase family 2 protein n=1 Tax=Actinomadura coerulea TaxID=46159 RepID=A0A7X0FXD0_9ACTN|nr:hypothetical protein [Actinomadura coerulea]MBB6395480.1 hypothetical protein [Actinomadura coerulea]GGQ25985.1 hypothetical protein GCM10010187_48260 [Actinomadura coerulea]